MFVLVILCLFTPNAQARQTIEYKDVIDYYHQSVKSAVLIHEGFTFLNGRVFIFKGTIEDFDFVVHNLLQIPNETDFFMPNESLELSGEIKDSE